MPTHQRMPEYSEHTDPHYRPKPAPPGELGPTLPYGDETRTASGQVTAGLLGAQGETLEEIRDDLKRIADVHQEIMSLIRMGMMRARKILHYAGWAAGIGASIVFVLGTAAFASALVYALVQWKVTGSL